MKNKNQKNKTTTKFIKNKRKEKKKGKYYFPLHWYHNDTTSHLVKRVSVQIQVRLISSQWLWVLVHLQGQSRNEIRQAELNPPPLHFLPMSSTLSTLRHVKTRPLNWVETTVVVPGCWSALSKAAIFTVTERDISSWKSKILKSQSWSHVSAEWELH